MKKFLSIFAAVACLATASAENAGGGSRIDYFNAEGELMSSMIVPNYAEGQGLFTIYQTQDDYHISGNGTSSDVKSIKVVPWGTEKYTVELESEDPGKVETYFQILADEDTRNEVASKVGEVKDNVLCGQKIRVFVRVPEGSYPTIVYDFGCTNGYGYIDDYPTTAFGPEYVGKMINESYVYVDPDSKQYIIDLIARNLGFERVDSDQNLWYVDIVMPNEPLALKASYVVPGNETLSQYVENVCRGLYVPSGRFSPNGNGEPYLGNLIGDSYSADFVSNIYGYTGDMSTMLSPVYKNNLVTWMTAFAYVGRANLLIDSLDLFTAASDDEKDLARAMMLTLRSHGYWRLLQYYAPRWQDSNGGSTLCMPLETTFSGEYAPAVTMREILERCYADLDEAISILSSQNYRRINIMLPDLNVARGVKMRLAMLSEDWQTAVTESEAILAAVPLTTNDELTSGFFNPADSWIWGAWNNKPDGEAAVGYYSFQSWNACNGDYPQFWNIGTNAISRELFLKMKPGDVRRSLYVMPETLSSSLAKIFGNPEKWYDDNLVVPGPYGTMKLNDETLISGLCAEYESLKPQGVVNGAFPGASVYYGTAIQFGAQTKFYQPGETAFENAAVVFMRAEEVLLSHAEALVNLGNMAPALEDINRLNGMRIEGYEALASSENLMDEIRLARRLELWGEGHAWFDMKRWNLPLEYKPWVNGDVNSGNIQPRFMETVPTDYANGWRGVIPNRLGYYENPLLDPSELGYGSQTQAPLKMPEFGTGRLFKADKPTLSPVGCMEMMPNPKK